MSDDGKFTSDKQPKRTPRGKSEKTKFIDALKRKSRTEDQFYELCIERAFDPDDNFAFKEILARLSPLAKAVAPTINFDFPDNAKPHIQAEAVMRGISEGIIPPDLGAQFISSIKAMVDIEENTDLKERIEKLEALLNGES
jgi:hypothetical protein